MADFQEKSMAAIFQINAEKYADAAYATYKKDDTWIDISWTSMNEMVHNLAYYLLSMGIEKGDKVGLFAPNSWEWHLAALAINSIGAVDVPIYATNSSEEAEYVLENSDSKLCFVGSLNHLKTVQKVKANLPLVKQLIVFEDTDSSEGDVISLSKALSEGESKKNPETFTARLSAIESHDLATIIYTSGTTGNPKGVMLTHNNFVSNVRNTFAEMKDKKTGEALVNHSDVYLSFLPLSHSLERTSGFHGAIWSGARTAFAEDVSKLLENFSEIRPTIIISVPRIYEKVHAGVVAKVSGASPVKKKIFNFAMRQATKGLPEVCLNKKPGGFKYKMADKLVFSKLKDQLGMDKLRYAISGGAPLSASDARFFIGMGMKILEGFGLSETTPILTFNRPWLIKPGTVGQVIPETDVRIADDGEIQAKGPQVMPGYYKNEAATKEAFTEDAYFRTGDIGIIDSDGCLAITGRIKDIIVTAGGKNISPQNLEGSIKGSAFIEQIGVIGDKKKYLSALIVPSFPELEKWAETNGVSFSSKDDLIASPAIQKLIKDEIDKNMTQYARVEQIKKFTLLNEEWTQDTGELTPTQKVKRKVLNEKYANEIKEMYVENAE
ncbi:MAG: long-chain fatty acid--CoA ligase [bacterium]|nr:long-chain fatty acid--CoA ligase [bacterium]